MEILIGIAKTNKHSTVGRGDGIECIERPSGGISVILADGHGGSRSVSGISTMSAIKAAQLVADGVRDSLVPRSVFEYLSAVQDGNFSVAMTMISADMETGNLLLCRNSTCPVLIRHEFGVDVYDEPSQPIGINKNVKPLTITRPMEEGQIVVTFSDGVLKAGHKRGNVMALKNVTKILESSRPKDAQYLAESVLERAMALDSYQAADHMTVVVMGVDAEVSENRVDRRTVRYAF